MLHVLNHGFMSGALQWNVCAADKAENVNAVFLQRVGITYEHTG